MLAYSPQKYGRLLARTAPVVIDDEREYDRLEAIFNKLMDKGEDRLSPEEARLFALLANLLEEYESRRLRKLPDSPPSETLRFLMEENELKQSEMLDIFGSQSAVSRALNGSRRIGPEHAKKLAKRFHVSPELFI